MGRTPREQTEISPVLPEDDAKAASRRPTRRMWRRALIVLFGVIFVSFAVIIARLAVLQIAQRDEWQRRATAQQLSDTVISPNRGAIYDCHMETLAQSMQVWTVIMSPHNIENEEQRVMIADELSPMLSVDRDELYQKTLKTESQYEVVKQKIERPLAEKLIAWVEEKGKEMQGVFRVISDYKRTYPYGSLLSCVLGFTGTDYYGLYGLEAEYDEVLRGKAGRIVTAQNGAGAELPDAVPYEKTVDAEDGDSLVLSIDQTIQHVTEKYLEEAVAQTGATNRACAIVMEVDTGAVLAMATKGDFDPNDPWTVADPNEAAAIAALSGDEADQALTDARQKQWVNKAISEYYEPGSVFKMFTTSMSLEEGVISEENTFTCEGYETVLDRTIRCDVYPGKHGTQTLAEAICHSCNPAFIQIGLSVGRELFFRYFTGFGFTEQTGIDMLSEGVITSSLYHTEDDLNPVQLATSAMGQTFKVTPIQMVTAMSAIANGGKLMQPYVVQQVIDSEGNVVSNTTPTVKRQVISSETASRVSALLANAVTNGGGRNAYVEGYRVAGKTGTSEKTDTEGDDVVASFGGFAPADDPQVAVLVMIDEPHSAVRYGGTIAAPVARKILAETLPYLGIEPKYTDAELAGLSVVTPAVEGKDIASAEAEVTAQSLKVQVFGEGSTVGKQLPEAGTAIPKNGTVVLYTGEENAQDHMVVVPDFTGYSLSEATALAAESGLNIQFTGTGLESGEARVEHQSETPGTELARGSVVVVEFIYRDTIA